VISKTMQDALNAQINVEQYSAQLYLAMSAHCESRSFRGFGHWLRVQCGEETAHALKLVTFLVERGSVTQVFEQTLAHERGITGKISALFEQARAERDHASEIALQWYVTEQVEEEARVGQIVDHLRAVGEQGGGIWYLDSKMGKRGKA
jgi:ferritin